MIKRVKMFCFVIMGLIALLSTEAQASIKKQKSIISLAQFIEQVEMAKVELGTPLSRNFPAELAVAQFVLETSVDGIPGASIYAREGRNLFGIYTAKKDQSLRGISQTGNKYFYVRKFPSTYACIREYIKILTEGKSYKAFQFGLHHRLPLSTLIQCVSRRYAEDPVYSMKLLYRVSIYRPRVMEATKNRRRMYAFQIRNFHPLHTSGKMFPKQGLSAPVISFSHRELIAYKEEDEEA